MRVSCFMVTPAVKRIVMLITVINLLYWARRSWWVPGAPALLRAPSSSGWVNWHDGPRFVRVPRRVVGDLPPGRTLRATNPEGAKRFHSVHCA